MTQIRKPLVVVCGVVSIVAGIGVILIACVMFALENSLSNCLLLSSLAPVFFLIAVACFIPKSRTVSLRIIGGIILFVASATLYHELMGAAPTKLSRKQLGMIGTIILGSSIMAWKGRWPDDPKTLTVDQAEAS